MEYSMLVLTTLPRRPLRTAGLSWPNLACQTHECIPRRLWCVDVFPHEPDLVPDSMARLLTPGMGAIHR